MLEEGRYGEEGTVLKAYENSGGKKMPLIHSKEGDRKLQRRITICIFCPAFNAGSIHEESIVLLSPKCGCSRQISEISVCRDRSLEHI